jgi:signal transduction histidine kinase
MALEAHIRKTGLDASLHADSAIEGVRFERAIETSCYFCILEALENVAHHAGGAEAIVTVDRTEERVSFSVSDKGPGFDPSMLPSTAGSDGQGLQAMADRLAAARGELTVRSKPGHGTTVTGWVPLEIQTEEENETDGAAAQDERVAAVQASSS